MLFHTTFKGKTDRCLPSRACRAEEQFSRPVLFSFGFSKNHWVSKETMREQVVAIEKYRKGVIGADSSLGNDQKMIVIWDVYCRHRDDELLQWMRTDFPQIVVLFVPANMTEICQPLDVFFNAPLKTAMADEMSGYLLQLASAFMTAHAGQVFKPDLRWSTLKEPLMRMLARVVTKLRSAEMVSRLKAKAWALFADSFTHTYQWTARSKVESDRSGRYFKAGADRAMICGLGLTSPVLLRTIDLLQHAPADTLAQLVGRKACRVSHTTADMLLW